MSKIFLLLFTFSFYTTFSQPIPRDVDSALNALKVKKTVYKDVQEMQLKKAPAHINSTGIKMFADTLMLFSFARLENFKHNQKLDHSIINKNKPYHYYSVGLQGNRRAFYYRGRFTVVDQHTNHPEWNAGLLYLDTSVMIVTGLHRYLITEWKPYDTSDSTIYYNLNILFIFNKSGKLVNHFAYDHRRLSLGTSVGFFNKDDLLDVVYFNKTEVVDGRTNWHFYLYSLNKKGKTKHRKFHKGGHSVIIPGK